MGKRVRKFQTKGVWNVYENGEFIGQVIKSKLGWKPSHGYLWYQDIQTAVERC